MKVKKILLILFACISILAFAAISASADTYGKYETLSYKVSNGTVTITDCDSKATEVAIPEQIEEYPVTIIDSRAFSHCKKLMNVNIPDSVKLIDSYAFAYCDKLESVVIGNDVE